MLREVTHHVERTALELVTLRQRRHQERDCDGIEARLAGTEVAIVPHDGEMAPTLPSSRRELERSGATRLPNIVVARGRARTDGTKPVKRKER